MLYDAEGNLIKTQTIRQYKKQSNGRYFAFEMEMKNEQNGRKSTLTIDQFRTGSGLPESAFTPAMMEK
jgi:outer membrane lipoprotein-sorting protein